MRRLARSDSRGAVATGAVVFEAALLTPLLVVIMLGIVEMALLMRDNVALTSLVRAGGQAAVSTTRSAGHTAASLPAEPATLADLTTSAIAHAKSSLSKDAISELWVYEADAAGFPIVNGSGHFDRCEDRCVAYSWDPKAHTFRQTGGQLDLDDIDLCSTDFGVYVKATHSFLTGVFQGVTISKHESFQFARGGDCRVVSS